MAATLLIACTAERSTDEKVATGVPKPAVSQTEPLAPEVGEIGVDAREQSKDAQTGLLSAATQEVNLVANSMFQSGSTGWTLWCHSVELPDTVEFIDNAVRVFNPHGDGKLVGVQQTINIKSGTLYRLSGRARSLLTNDSAIGFGARLACYIPGAKEHQIVWMSEYNNWLQKSITFTNYVEGTATIYVHLGYGNIQSTGDFTKIVLEPLN